MAKSKDEIIESGGNVFADLGLPDPGERLLKAKLAIKIKELLEQRELTQTAIAELLGIDQPKVSRLLRGKLSGFSLERLFDFLNRLGYNVEVRISPTTKKNARAETHVRAA
jgi:predicted XRE-type DNA-binding protein